MKKCTRCEVEKPLSEYNKHVGRKDGLNSICKVCKQIAAKESYKKHRDSVLKSNKKYRGENDALCKARGLKYREKHRDHAKQKSATWYSLNKERAAKNAKVYRLKKHYGLTVEDKEAMLKKQKHSCAICNKSFENIALKPHIDHDHKTGKVRGILCQKCNQALGMVYDSCEILKNAVKYLNKHKKDS